MGLTHAILVSLSEETGSGYELARRFDRSIGYFWAATHQQIYRTLGTMEGAGWVHVTPVAQHGKRDKKVYTVSTAGREELARWIAEPVQKGPVGRSGSFTDNRTRDLAVKVRAATFGDVRAVGAQVEELRTERTTLLDTYRTYEKQQFPDPAALTGSALHQYLVLRGGIRAEEGAIDWLSEVADALKETR